MPALSPTLIRDNPWWADRAAIRQDADLRRLATADIRFEHSIPFALDVDAVYTLRGPRQVGKSTLLKRIVAQLLERQHVSPRCILYTDVEGASLTTVPKLRNALTGYVAWARGVTSRDRLYLLLDEITGLRDWGTVIRALYREGRLDNATVIATGSHALDLARGGETAPGRRGERAVSQLDWVMMPLSFRDFVIAHAPTLGAALPTLDIFDPHAAYQAAEAIVLRSDEVRPLFDRYLLTGGYPHAMSDEQAHGRVAEGIYLLYQHAITGQMRRAGHRDAPFREIVAWVANGHLGREFSWNTVSGETEVGTKDTARMYIEDAERLFLWHVLYRAHSAERPTPALRSPKKLYPVDPFAWHVLASWAAGEADPWAASLARLATPAIRGELVESVAADHFVRRFGRLAFYHRSEAQHEIDLVLHRARTRARIEVKYRQRVAPRDARQLVQSGGGILASVDEFRFDQTGNVAVIPLFALLAGYGESITLYPARP